MPVTSPAAPWTEIERTLWKAQRTYECRYSVPTDRNLHSRLGVDSFWEAETKMLEDYSEEFARKGYIPKKIHLKNIVGWKTKGRAVHYVDDLDDRGELREISRRAFERETCGEAMETLSELPGVRAPVASAILMFANPDRYTVMDPRATTALQYLGDVYDIDLWTDATEATPEYYADYCLVCHEVSEQMALSLREIDRGLFILEGKLEESHPWS